MFGGDVSRVINSSLQTVSEWRLRSLQVDVYTGLFLKCGRNREIECVYNGLWLPAGSRASAMLHVMFMRVDGYLLDDTGRFSSYRVLFCVDVPRKISGLLE